MSWSFPSKVFAGCKGVEKMPRVNVQRAGDNDAVDILHIENSAIIIEGLNAGHFTLGLVAATAVHICHRYKFDAWTERICPANRSRDRRPQSCRRGRGRLRPAPWKLDMPARRLFPCRLFQKSASGLIGHGSPLMCVPLSTARPPVAEAFSFPPNSGATIFLACPRRPSASPG